MFSPTQGVSQRDIPPIARIAETPEDAVSLSTVSSPLPAAASSLAAGFFFARARACESNNPLRIIGKVGEFFQHL